MPTAPELDTVIACLALSLGRSFFSELKGTGAVLRLLYKFRKCDNKIAEDNLYLKKELLHSIFADEAFNDSKNRSD